ncbi:S8 family peptidase [Spirosoma gilvum]
MKPSIFYGFCLVLLIGTGVEIVQAQTTFPTSSRSIRKYPSDWYFRDLADDSIPGISLDKAYRLLAGRKSKPVIVAVIDNGVDITHEDLKQVIWTNTAEIPANGIDDDRNGYVDDVHGWNFRGAKNGSTVEHEQAEITHVYALWKTIYDQVDSTQLRGDQKREWRMYQQAKAAYLAATKQTTDTANLAFTYNLRYNSSLRIGDDPDNLTQHNYGSPLFNLTPNLTHGTHVAGIIAALRTNQIGMKGISDNVLIMPILATTALGDERDKDVANAIRYAVRNGAKVINLSFSKPFSPFKQVVDEAIQDAETNGVLIFHAAGNDGSDNDTTNHYPIAQYKNGQKAGNFITVGWTKPFYDERLVAYYSNYGALTVDLFAPGSDIVSTLPGNQYGEKSGTSMATPFVSGVAALLWSYFPSLTATQIKDILLRSTSKPALVVNKPGSKMKVAFHELSVTGGIVNAFNAVKMAFAIEKTKK